MCEHKQPVKNFLSAVAVDDVREFGPDKDSRSYLQTFSCKVVSEKSPSTPSQANIDALENFYDH